MNIIKYLQLPFRFDAGRMQEEVHAITAADWLPHYQVKHYEGSWTAIPLRSVNGAAADIYVSPLPDAVYMNTAFMEQSPYLREILSAFKCPLLGVRLLKLDAGAVIKEHRDAELNFEKGEVRLHIPVITHEAVAFYLDNERVNMKEGECWYLNFNLPHRIVNNSKINRIHLVIDALVNEWLTAVFNDPAITIKKETEDLSGSYDEATRNNMIKLLREMNTTVSLQMADDLEKALDATVK
jgi:hypothetical protein